MDNHFGYICADRAYTLAELAQIMTLAKPQRHEAVGIGSRTIREALTELGVPISKLGRTAVIPGRTVILALERQAARMCTEEELVSKGLVS